ncbi:MAG: NADH-quinone oxidoreductase subunit H [Chloroflexi bacterium]|nr:MAG: NADH-quinone oxidoreductase subunit H [Chloroflexota bacterium]MBA4374812.1 NADH-quinone oxidoreductase subunit NuoH [Anaerolinea sp.]
MTFGLFLEWAVKSLIVILGMTIGFAYVTLFERRVLARFQVRIGPNRAGKGGILQPVADALKLIFKEDLIPDKADKLIFVLAPVLTVIPALIITGVVPWGPPITLFGKQFTLSVTDINVGALYILTVTSISIYGITLAGWSSNNKYATLGGLRATAQMISYELALGLSFIGPILLAGSMSLTEIVHAQKSVWFIVYQPLGAIIYMISTIAEINRSPFDMPEAEQELTAGYHVEYSGMKFALFFMAEYIKMIAICMIGATLFLGGFQGPFLDQQPWLGPIYLLLKVVVLLFGLVWIRATLPRIRYDRLMAFGWKILFPLALLNIMVTALVMILVGG